MGVTFWISQALTISGLGLVAYILGILVRHRNMRVNYTRKGNFFALFFVPTLVNHLIPPEASPLATTLRTVVFILTLAFFAKPIRERILVIATMFLSYDRPEDWPFTLLLLTTQLVVGYLVVVPLAFAFRQYGISQLMFIPIVVHGLGDGFAEPVGVRFGRHKYATRALFSSKRYTRSLEGSAVIFVVGMTAVAAFRASFTPVQFLLALFSVPLLMTLAEALLPANVGHAADVSYRRCDATCRRKVCLSTPRLIDSQGRFLSPGAIPVGDVDAPGE